MREISLAAVEFLSYNNIPLEFYKSSVTIF